MKPIQVTFPEIALIASTRGMLGAGLALLLADSLNLDQRKAIGWTLFLIGVVSSIPIGIHLLHKRDAAMLKAG